ncbi:MAG TPA: hypothetical protein VNH38_01025 [Candidatus Dormibacteraeota bacterium]|nr:hypothetical protein [Candidatus Dormibacteraeota bacterium]
MAVADDLLVAVDDPAASLQATFLLMAAPGLVVESQRSETPQRGSVRQ